MAGAYLQITQGDSYTFSTTVLLDGVEQNIYGADVTMYAISSDTTLVPNVVLINVNTSTSAVVISGNNNANITVTLNSAYTSNIANANNAHWWLRAQLTNGSVYTLDHGRCCVLPSVPTIPF